jgi:hypothetical protein
MRHRFDRVKIEDAFYMVNMCQQLNTVLPRINLTKNRG